MLPVKESNDPLDDELVNRVIYSKRTVKAVGHGCAADWNDGSDGTSLWTDVMPAWEMAPMAFDVTDADGNSIRLPMRAFAEMPEKDSDALALLDSLVSRYESWIAELELSSVPDGLGKTTEALTISSSEAWPSFSSRRQVR